MQLQFLTEIKKLIFTLEKADITYQRLNRMDLIPNYESEESFYEKNPIRIDSSTSAISFLITYSQVDLSKFPTLKSFADIIIV